VNTLTAACGKTLAVGTQHAYVRVLARKSHLYSAYSTQMRRFGRAERQ
jgi:hypothetical protein